MQTSFVVQDDFSGDYEILGRQMDIKPSSQPCEDVWPGMSGEKAGAHRTWKRHYQGNLDQIRIILLLMRHPSTPWYCKAIPGCALGYIFSPVQVVPNFVPIIGQVDDVLVLYCSMKLLQKITPPEVLASCQVRIKQNTPSDDQSHFPVRCVGEVT